MLCELSFPRMHPKMNRTPTFNLPVEVAINSYGNCLNNNLLIYNLMKPLMIALIFVLTSCMAVGQNIIDKHFTAYKGQEAFTQVHVSSKAFELSAYVELQEENEEFEAFKEFLKTVTSFDMMVGNEVAEAIHKYQTALAKVKATHEELLQVKDRDERFTFLIDEENGWVNELVMVGCNSDKLAIFSLTGNMDLNQLIQMSNMMHIEGDHQIKQLFEHKVHEVTYYPNPIDRGENLVLQLPRELSKGTVSLYNLSGVKVKEYELNGEKQQIEMSGLDMGNYILEVKNENVSVKKKVLVK